MKFTLTATDTMASVLQSMAPETGVTQKQSYSAYGDTVESANDVQIPGFNGERRDPLTGTTHLGNGYRAYNPTLMRFHAPDSMSPFGAGGINCYAYCNGDPINNSDPSGHMSAQAEVGIGLGVLGLALGTATFGMSIAAKITVVASVSAIATGIASAATENSNPEASAALGWVSVATGLVGGAIGVAQAAGQGIRNFSRPRPVISEPSNLRYAHTELLKNNRPNELLDEYNRHNYSKNITHKISNLEQLKKVVDDSLENDLLKFVIGEDGELYTANIKNARIYHRDGNNFAALQAIKETNHPLLPVLQTGDVNSSLHVKSAGYIINRKNDLFTLNMWSGHYTPTTKNAGHMDALIRRWGGDGVTISRSRSPFN